MSHTGHAAAPLLTDTERGALDQSLQALGQLLTLQVHRKGNLFARVEVFPDVRRQEAVNA
uniref:Uncharacterized protein n=1 Tax=Anguilla anguilla TaxID=7936 RepID=A0A0E9P6B7_ANGAN